MRPKRKIDTHIMEENSLQIVKELLPKFWTIREYKPDYGLDLTIEFFEKNDDLKQESYDTLGEHLFVQLKSVKKIQFSKLEINKRNNIENEPLKELGLEKEIEILKFKIDSDELVTIYRMGNTLPVILFVVDIDQKRLFFICLNDYIDKIILTKEPNFFEKEQKSKTIYIPVSNEITIEKSSLIPLMFYAKRPKYYSLFNKISFQKNELNYCDENILIDRTKHYANILLRFDIWSNSIWNITTLYKIQLMHLIANGEVMISYVTGFSPNDKDLEWEYGISNNLYTQKQVLNFQHIHSLWDRMNSMNSVYESLCREWFLPTQFG